ncbi:MAG TPA: SDR family NAD(P)-dependent oxidoreductase [Jiangellaceae bacterium]|nr:SDR family NAD(P)-dependent oxidoreductase [Jiangellaceae bacterium]
MSAAAAAADQPLVDHTALITGATAGIGYHTARALARSGARVIITGRDWDTGERAAAAIRDESGADSLTFLRADHSTVGGNQDLAERVRATVPRLDLLVNNVGGLYPNRWETPDGYEATLAMNFVGPYTLTTELLPLLTGAPSRCVNVVSAGFKMWKVDPFTDLHSTDRFVSGDAYAHGKLLNVLASLAWARRLTSDQITVNVVHPGLSWTRMTQSMTAQTIPSMRLPGRCCGYYSAGDPPPRPAAASHSSRPPGRPSATPASTSRAAVHQVGCPLASSTRTTRTAPGPWAPD